MIYSCLQWRIIQAAIKLVKSFGISSIAQTHISDKDTGAYS
jgi:hypothetical protein